MRSDVLHDSRALPRALWQAAQLLGLGLTGALIVGLWTMPDATLRVLWYAVIPVLPAVFLVNPALWRNMCPLATLNTVPGARSRGLKLDARMLRWTPAVGLALLLVLVPARRFLFNMDGRALALVILAVALLALILGFVFDRKAGFCNSICPVLPVEKLYGQSPLARVQNAHCPSCSLCTTRGCLDLAPHKAAQQALGSSRKVRHWLLTPFGAFAAAFPGFVVAYYLIPDTTIAHAGTVYLQIALGSALSFAIVALPATALHLEPRYLLPAIGAFTLLLYYWFGAASIAAAWQLGPPFTSSVKALALMLVGYWVTYGIASAPKRSSVR